eukprot:403365203
MIVVDSLQIVEKPDFITYLLHWIQWELYWPQSLHYLDSKNQYQQAIHAVGSILEYYDNDRLFPVYGFGGIAKFLGQTKTSHCFPLNGNHEQPEVCGVQGIMDVYRKTLPQIELSGPTYYLILSIKHSQKQKKENTKIYLKICTIYY